MILDQNTIVLNPCNGFYDEYTLVSDVQADKNDLEVPVCILPGAIVGQKTVDPIFDANKWPFFANPGEVLYGTSAAGENPTAEERFNAKLAAAKTAGGATLEEFYAQYPRQHVITAGFAGEGSGTNGALSADDLNGIEVLILVENALLGKGICALYFPGEKTPVYSPVSGDRYLGRCVPGEYTEGDALYLCDYENEVGGKKVKGFYFCKGDATDANKQPIVHSTEIKAFAGEDFICPAATDENRKPYGFFLDGIDDSTTERPASIKLNGALTNLLRVRMA